MSGMSRYRRYASWFLGPLLLLLILEACVSQQPTPLSQDAAGKTPPPPQTPRPTPEPTEPLMLSVAEPKEEIMLTSSRITVSGSTRADAVVSIDGTIIDVDSQGGFSAEVNLEAGPNIVEVIASDFYGNEKSVMLTVFYVAALPLTIIEPLNESVVGSRQTIVRGMTNADAVVSVNDAIVPLDSSGGFSIPVVLEEGPNFIEVVASDFAGHTSTVTVTVISIP